MVILRRTAIALLLLITFSPVLALGQATRAGVVSTLQGTATASRAGAPQPVPLKFKDDVFLQDRIQTGDQSVARILLGGKALVTVRERSVLTVTEIPGRSTVNLESGKIGLAVARERMSSGESVNIRTSNAVAAVRGTVVVAEVTRATAQATPGPVQIVSNFYVLRDQTNQGVQITQLNTGATSNVLAGGGFSIAGASAGRSVPIPANINAGLQTRAGGQHTTGSPQATANVATTQTQQAVVLTEAVLRAPAGITAAPAPVIPPTIPKPTQQTEPQFSAARPSGSATPAESGSAPGSNTPSLTDKASSGSELLIAPSPPTVTVTQPLPNITGNFTGDPAFGGRVFSVGPDQSITFAGQLVVVNNATIDLTGPPPVEFLEVSGNLTSQGNGAFIVIDPTTVTATGLLRVSGALTLAGPLLEATGTAATDTTRQVPTRFVLSDDFIRVTATTAGATIRSTSSLPLVTLIDSTIEPPLTPPDSPTVVNGHFMLLEGGAPTPHAIASLILDGPLLKATNSTITLNNPDKGFLHLKEGAVVQCPSSGSGPCGTGAFVQLSASTLSIGASDGDAEFLKIGSQDSMTIGGGLLSAADQSTVTVLNSPVVSQDGGTFTAGGDVVALTGNSTLSASGVLNLSGGATFIATGSVLSVAESTVNISGDGVIVNGATLNAGGLLSQTGGTTTVSGSVLSATDSTVNISGDGVIVNGGTLNAGGLLSQTGGTITVPGNLLGLFSSGTLTVTGGQSAVTVNGGTLTVSGSLIIGDHTATNVTLTGSVLTATNATVSLGALSGGGGGNDVVLLGTTPLLQLTNSTLTVAARPLLKLDLNFPQNFAGQAAVITGGSVTIADTFLDEVANLNVTNPNPFVQVTGGAVITQTNTAAPFIVLGDGTTLAGPLLQVSNSQILNFFNLVETSGQVTGNGPGAFISADPSVITTASDVILVGGTLNLAGGAFRDVGGTITAGGNLLRLAPNSSFTSTGPGPVAEFIGSIVTAAQGFVNLSGNSRAAFNGSLVRATDSVFRIQGGGIASFEPNFGAVLPLGDDTTTTRALPFNFPFLGQTFNSVNISSNGFLSFGADFGSQCCTGNRFDLLNSGRRAAGAWFDLIPVNGGQILFNTFADRAVATFSNVPECCSSGSNTFQIQIFSDGRVLFVYRSVLSRDHQALIGVSPGGGAADPGPINFSTSLPFNSGSVGTVYQEFPPGTLNFTDASLAFTPNGLGGWSVTSSFESALAAFIEVAAGASLTQQGTGALVDLLRTRLALPGRFLAIDGSADTLTSVRIVDQLLNAVDSPLDIGDVLSITNGPLSSTTALPAVTLLRSNLTTRGRFLDVSGAAAAVNLAGPLLLVTDGDLSLTNTTGAFMRVRDSASVIGTGLTPFVQFARTAAGTNSVLFAGEFFRQESGTVTLQGGLLSASGTVIDNPSTAAEDTFIRQSGGTFSSAGAELVKLSAGSSLTVGDEFLNLSGGTFTSSGVLLVLDGTAGASSAQINGAAAVLVNGGTLNAGGLLSQIGGTTTVIGNLLSLQNGGTATVTGGQSAITLNGGTLTVGGALVSGDDTGTTLVLTGPVLTATNNATINIGGVAVAGPSDTLVATGTAPLLQLIDSSLTVAAGEILALDFSSPVTFGGQAAVINGGSVTVSDIFLDLGNVTISNANPFIQVLGGAVITQTNTAEPFIVLNNGTTLAGPLLQVSNNSTIQNFFNLVESNGTVTSNGAGSLVSVTDSIVTTTSDMFSIAGTLNLSGPLLTATSSALTTAGDLLRVASAGNVTSTGPLLLATDSQIVTGGSLLRVQNGSSFTRNTGSDALLQLDRTPLTTGQDVVRVESGGSLTLSSTLLRATGSSITSTAVASAIGYVTLDFASGNPANVRIANVAGSGGEVTGLEWKSLGIVFSTPTLQLNLGCGSCFGADRNSTDDFSGTLVGQFVVPNTNTPSTVSSLSITFCCNRQDTTTIRDASGNVLAVRQGDVPSQGGNIGSFSIVFGFDAINVLTFDGTGGAAGSGVNVITVESGGHLLNTSADALVRFTDATVGTGTDFGALLSLPGGSVELGGPLLAATSSTLTLFASLVSVSDGGTLVTRAPVCGGVCAGPYPLVALDGGSLVIGNTTVSGTLLSLTGRAGAIAADPDPNPVTGGASGLTLGTDRPVQHGGGGPLFEMTGGAAVDVRGPSGSAVKLDTALLEATAPLLNLTGNSTLTTSGNTIDLSFRAKVSSLASALVAINASTLNVTSHLVNVAGGSRLNATGDLLQVSNASVVNITNGTLLNVSGGSIASVSGALVRFTGAGGNVINVSNNLAPTGFLNGVPVFSSLGGTTGISITNLTPLVGLNTLGTIKINNTALPNAGVTGSLIAIQAGGGAIKIGP